MDPNNTNIPAPNTNPDLFPSPSFIPEPPVQAPRKNKKNLVIIIGGVLVLLLLVLTIAGLVYSKRPKDVKPSLSPEQLAVTQVAEKYFSYAAQAKAEEAYILLSTSTQERVTKQDFILYVGGVLYNSVDFAKCTRKNTPEITDKTAAVSYVCPSKDGNNTLNFDMKLSQSGQSYTIDSYDMNASSK